MVDKLPIIYIRGYGGPTAGINTAVEDPFYGFNGGSTHIRVAGDGDPAFYQFEGPLIRLIGDEGYRVYVHGSQESMLDNPDVDLSKDPSIWIHRFYDQAATTFSAPPHENLAERLLDRVRQKVTAVGFNIEDAARDLYTLVQKVISRTTKPGQDPTKVFLVAHSMGGLIARCMIQKICEEPGNKHATELVARFFTYGTPHGGIRSAGGIAQWVEETFGPAGSNIFAPELMQGYLDPGKKFGDVCDPNWDPQEIKPAVFPVDDIFCLIGTDPADYGWASRTAMGPQTDGLVHIDNAYVRGAHRAYVHRSHSGPYGEVNSEEGYQNLRRFLFGRWAVLALLVDASLPADASASWQLDMRLSIRGLSVVMSEQLAEHWCPIMLNAPAGQPDPLASADGVPLAGTFLLDPADPDNLIPGVGGRMRYTLTLRLFNVPVSGGVFNFSNSLEQVPYWQDWLIIDVDPALGADGTQGPLTAYAAWGSLVPGFSGSTSSLDLQLPPEQGGQPLTFTPRPGVLESDVLLPAAANSKGILGGQAKIRISVRSRQEPATT
jgi:pimeloyl-ACP methyl ester carboxylesterase